MKTNIFSSLGTFFIVMVVACNSNQTKVTQPQTEVKKQLVPGEQALVAVKCSELKLASSACCGRVGVSTVMHKVLLIPHPEASEVHRYRNKRLSKGIIPVMECHSPLLKANVCLLSNMSKVMDLVNRNSMR